MPQQAGPVGDLARQLIRTYVASLNCGDFMFGHGDIERQWCERHREESALLERMASALSAAQIEEAEDLAQPVLRHLRDNRERVRDAQDRLSFLEGVLFDAKRAASSAVDAAGAALGGSRDAVTAVNRLGQTITTIALVGGAVSVLWAITRVLR